MFGHYFVLELNMIGEDEYIVCCYGSKLPLRWREGLTYKVSTPTLKSVRE